MIISILENILIPTNRFIYGFADLRGLLNDKFSDFNYGISIGKRLDNKIIDKLLNGPTKEYYNHYKQINEELSVLTKKIHSELALAGIESIAVEPTIEMDSEGYENYLKTLTFDISHKMVATRAGLGWIGKTDLFISKAFGPRLRLASILLKENPGVASIPVEKSKCGKCNICVEKCPANAANGKVWDVGVYRDDFFDAKKCREKCGELTWQNININERICGICVSVCPIGKRNLNKN